jgi:hypothetical protein
MPEQVYIVVGNHRSMVGINEIVYTLYSALSENFSVEVVTRLKQNSINVLIDEFSSPAYTVAIDETKKRYPDTKIVVVATEFVTPVRILGLELIKTFNFFGAPRDWTGLFGGAVRSLIGGMPSYMRMRYLGFLRTLEYADLLVSVQPAILRTLSEAGVWKDLNLAPPLMVYPRIGMLRAAQQYRLEDLPVGFIMTGTLTRYRSQIARKLVRTFRRAGWFASIFQHVPFETAPVSSSSASKERAHTSRFSSAPSSPAYLQAQYDSIAPASLFNINPPQTPEWPYSSPMRILRAIMLGQIPVVTKKFHDHLLEEVAMMWDGTSDAALKFGSYQLSDRQGGLNDYLRSIAEYDQAARDANKPFVSAMMALCGGGQGNAGRVAASKPSPIRHAG